jgi:hypothetical protein
MAADITPIAAPAGAAGTLVAMATQEDVRRIALALPGTIAATQGFAFSVEHKGKAKGYVWVWMERVDPRKPRVPQPQVIAARVANQVEKASLLAADPDKFFTEPHYNGFPAVLVRLPEISLPELQQVIVEAWRCMAPKELVAAYDAGDAVPATTASSKRTRAPTAKAATTRRTQAPAAKAGASSTRKRAPAAKAAATERTRGPAAEAGAPSRTKATRR